MANFNIKLNKKGNMFDFVEVAKLFIVIVIVGFLSYTVLTNFSTAIDGVDTGDNYTEMIEGARDKTSRSLDFAALAFLVMALIFSVIMARRVPTETTYIAIVLAVSVVFFLISFILANAFGELMNNGSISNYVNLYLPITKILLIKLPFVTAIYLAAVLIAFFNKD